MSQFPRRPFNFGRRNFARPAPRLGIQGTINTPGTVVLPATPESTAQAQQIREFLDATGSLANQVSSFAGGVARKAETEIEEHKIHMRAAANQESRISRATAQANITDHANAVDKQEGESEGEAIARYVDDRSDDLTQDQTEDYKKEFKRQDPALIADIARERKSIKNQAREDLLDLNSNLAVSAESTEELNAVFDETRALENMDGFSDTQIAQALFLPALKSAAENGDEGRFSMIVETMQDRFPDLFTDEITKAEAVFAAENERKRRAIEVEQIDAFNGMLNDGRSATDIRDFIEEQRQAETIDEKMARQLFDDINRRDASDLQEKIDTIKEGIKDDFIAQIVGDSFDDNATPLGSFVGNIEIPIGNDGESVTVSDRELKRAVTDQALARIADRSANDPQRALAGQVAWLTRNNISDVPQLTSIMDGTENLIDETGRIPGRVAQGFGLWRLIREQNGTLAESLVSSETQEFYEITDTLLNVDGADMDSALREAARAVHPDTPVPAKLPIKQFMEEAPRRFRKANNAPQVAIEAQGIAQRLTRARGMSGEKAKAAAFKSLASRKVVFNGYVNDSRSLSSSTKEAIESISDHVAEEFVTDNPSLELKAKNLTLRTVNGKSWFLADRKTGTELPNGPLFIPSDLDNIHNDIRLSNRLGKSPPLIEFQVTKPTVRGLDLPTISLSPESQARIKKRIRNEAMQAVFSSAKRIKELNKNIQAVKTIAPFVGRGLVSEAKKEAIKVIVGLLGGGGNRPAESKRPTTKAAPPAKSETKKTETKKTETKKPDTKKGETKKKDTKKSETKKADDK